MKSVIFLHLCAFLIIDSSANKNCADLKLELVQVLLRHGARTPIRKGYDIFNYTDISEYEPWGFEGLTNVGKQQEYAFGRFLRKRYAHFLSSKYKSEDVYAYSSDTPRTKISLELALAGLYPTVFHSKWDAFLDWNPLPFSYAPMKLDIILSAYRNVRYVNLFLKVMNSDEFKETISNYTEFFQFVAEKTLSNEATLTNTFLVFDLLISNEYMNLPLPNWYTPKVKQTFMEIIKLAYDATAATIEMRKVGTGALIKSFVENMNLDETVDNHRKIYLYGGHEINIALFTRSHNIQEFRYPFYGSALIFEKLRDSQNHLYVRLFAWDGNGKLTALKLGKNNECCPINDYLEIVKPIIPSERELDDLIGNLNSTKIRNILFNSSANGKIFVNDLLN